MLEYKNYIFDLYGTLVDIRTNESKAYLWNKLAMFYSLKGAGYSGKELKESYQAEILNECALEDGRYDPLYEIEIRNVFRTLYEKKGVDPSDELVDNTALLFRTISHEKIVLFSDVNDFLAKLKNEGKKIYLLSNAQEVFTLPEIKHLGLYDKFDDIFISSKEGVKKPSSEYFDRLFEKHGLKKEESIYIGNDFYDDVQGALFYGIDCIYVDNYVNEGCGNRFQHIAKPVSVDTMRKSDANTIETIVSSKELMLRAGKGIAKAANWIEPVGIVCGKGNNAGDGYVVADELNRLGMKCEIVLLSEDFSEDGKYYYDIAVSNGVAVKQYDSKDSFDSYGSILDCIFGTGFKGDVRGKAKEVIDKINASKAYVVSADINSGLNGDTGQGDCVISNLTVPIGSFKTGHFVGRAKEVIKNKVNIDIGINIID